MDALARAFATPTPGDRQLDDLGECVEAPDPKARELCRPRYAEDLKPAAIAGRPGVAANTVAKALQRIRERLRDCIDRKAVRVGA